jgi:hypothetical protein
MQGRDLKKENDWFDRPASRRLLWRLLYGACTVSVLLELVLIATHQRHGHFGEASPDGWWFFYALLGFIACALMILAAKGLGAWLKRPEDYYSETEETTLPEDIDESLR